MKAKFVNPFTDFGFKKIFGEVASKPLLIDFLTCLLPESQIVDLTFKDKDLLGKSDENRKSIFDIYCNNKSGEKIIVELQKAKQNYFKDRSIYCASFPIQQQSEKGVGNYKLKAVYCIGILDFKFNEDIDSTKDVIHTLQFKNQHNQIFYDKLKFVYLEMPHFNKNESELETRLDKWLYFIRNLEDLQHIPELFKDDIFQQVFEKIEIAKYSEQERFEYEESLKIYRDYKITIDSVYDDGIIEGKTKGKIEVANSLKENGVSIDVITRTTGLSVDEIYRL